jgi:hypothetical protein
MQHTLATCQLDAAHLRHVVPETAHRPEQTSGRRKRWAPAPAETVAHTPSRRTGPRAWLRALERAVAAGLIPGYNATTQAIVDVIAGRMGYDTGHARYVMQDVMERTGLGKTAVTDHIKMLRAGGWLAWVEHGSLRNALRSLGLPGYAKTATVYAATIPPLYDAYEGNILDGAGYSARVVSVTEEARERRVVEASRTPSLWVVQEEGQVQVVGGKDGSTATAAATKTSRRKKTHTVTGYRITGPRIDRARQVAMSVRPHVNWIQGASHDQLSWVFLDLVARDWSESRIVLWLRNVGEELGVRRWRPRFPHRVIAAAIRRDDQAAAQRAITVGPDDEPYVRAVAPNTAFQAARDAVRAGGPQVPAETLPTVDQAPEDTWDRATLREAAAADPALVLSFARFAGRDETLRVYGTAAARILDAAEEFGRAGFLVTA